MEEPFFSREGACATGGGHSSVSCEGISQGKPILNACQTCNEQLETTWLSGNSGTDNFNVDLEMSTALSTL